MSDEGEERDESEQRRRPGGSVYDVWGAAADELEPSHRLELSDEERYEEGPLLGTGGMGRVVATHDSRLGRDVARKTAHRGPVGARLAREAFITAQLDHPGIVPVYDAGTDEDGAPWYTMRLVRGRTLTEAIEAPGASRSALLRHLLAATQAVAYAHSRGFVHRDLKPDNILVGAFGETQVADWGLAVALGEAAAAEGAAMGTPAYMSPEQVEGGGASPRSDVWALGAALRQIVTGVAPYADSEPGATLERRRESTGAEPVAEGPRELAAIIQRAQARDPEARYPDAGALAEDLARYLDGRRVLAHTYTARELLGRLARLWRAPLLVGGAALLALTVTIGFAAVRQERERRRAIEAEARAVLAREGAEASLANAWVAQARTAERRQDRARAERYALAALRSAERPAARGVLVAMDHGPRPRRVEQRGERECEAAWLGGERWFCQVGNELLAIDAGGDVAWRVESTEPPSLALLPSGDALIWDGLPGGPRRVGAQNGKAGARLALTSDDLVPQWVAGSPTDGRVLVGRAWQWNLLDLDGGPPRAVQPCAPGAIGYSPVWADGLLMLCSDHQIAVAPEPKAGEVPRFARRSLPPEAAESPARVALWGRDVLVVTTDFGRVVLLDRDTLEVRGSAELSDHPLVEIAAEPGRGLLAVRGDRGDVLVWQPDSGVVTTLPGSAHAIGFDGGDLVVLGQTWQRWRFPQPEPPRSLGTSAGVGALALRDDGEQVTGCLGDGALAVWELGTGASRRVPVLPGVVMKDGSYTPEGDFVVATASNGVIRPPLVRFGPDWSVVGEEGEGDARRVESLADGSLLTFDWGDRATRLLSPGGAETRWDWGLPHDLAAAPSRERVALALPDRVLSASRTEGGLVEERAVAVPGVRGVAVDDEGALFAVVPGGVVVAEPDGTERRLEAPMQIGTAVAVSPSGALVAAGDLAGRVWLWDRAGALLAEVHAHSTRVSGLAFRSDDELVSGSWDASMRRWSLGSLRRGVAELEEELGPWAELRPEDLAGVP